MKTLKRNNQVVNTICKLYINECYHLFIKYKNSHLTSISYVTREEKKKKEEYNAIDTMTGLQYCYSDT